MSTNNVDGGEDGEISREEAEELIEEIERRRSLKGLSALAVAAIGILFSLFQLILAAKSFTFEIPILALENGMPAITSYQVSLQLLQANAIHVAFALVLGKLDSLALERQSIETLCESAERDGTDVRLALERPPRNWTRRSTSNAAPRSWRRSARRRARRPRGQERR